VTEIAEGIALLSLCVRRRFTCCHCIYAERKRMRTTLFLVAGLLLMSASLLLGRLFSANYPGATFVATIAFVGLWLVIAGANMWVGIVRAGYSVTEELPILLLIFGLPAAVAIFLKWKIL
jgi:hypothetical protein